MSAALPLPAEAPVALACRGLDVVAGGRRLVRALDLDLRGGRLVAILGRNGVGKTLTLHTLAGLRMPAAGSVHLDARPLAGWPVRARARRLSLLTQTTEDPFPATVLETALIGRHPHLPFWQVEGAADLAAARAALAALGIDGLAEREVGTLSGGERRRLAVATLLAQDPAACLLDEPTNHLDPAHRLEVLDLFRARTAGGGLVLASLHDPTLAARYADDALLLHGDGRWQYGPAAEVLGEASLSALYGVAMRELAAGGQRVFITA